MKYISLEAPIPIVGATLIREFSVLETPEQQKAWIATNMKVREKLIGLIYSKELLDRTVKVANQIRPGYEYHVKR